MFTTHSHTSERRYWLLAALAAIVGLLLLTTSAAGIDDTYETEPPNPLPAHIKSAATPVNVLPSLPRWTGTNSPDATITELWTILEHHRRGNLTEASDGWSWICLPEKAAVWQQLGLGMCHLQHGELDAAYDTFGSASQAQPDNPVVYYCLGAVSLFQARVATEWPDAVRMRDTQLVAYETTPTLHLNKALYELRAEWYFERSIELSTNLTIDQSLLPGKRPETVAYGYMLDHPYDLAVPAAAPLVSDFLRAIGCEEYQGNAHLAIAEICLQRGQLERCKASLLKSEANGMQVPETWLELGEACEADERAMDAVYAYGQAMRKTPSPIKPLRGYLRNMKTVFTDF
jgi:hypothetical protein